MGLWGHEFLIGRDKKNWVDFVNIFLTIWLNMCFVCSKEPSFWDGSFEYPQHMFFIENIKA